MAKVCENCNTANENNALYCKSCGYPMKEDQPSPGVISKGEWFIYNEKENLGPFSDQEIEGLILNGKIDDSNFIWTQGLDEWIPLSESKFDDILNQVKNSDGIITISGKKDKTTIKKEKTEKNKERSKPTAAIVFEIIELITIILQLLSLIFFASTINRASYVGDYFWAMTVIILTLVMVIAVTFTNCFYLFYLKKRNLSRSYNLGLYLQILLNLYPAALMIFGAVKGIGFFYALMTTIIR